MPEFFNVSCVRDASFPEDKPLVLELFREYENSLSLDLSFQDFEAEVAGLPGKYAPPQGALLLADDLGCIAMRSLEPDICEMKRLYVRKKARGCGVGRALVAAILDRARTTGYRAMRLDTMPTMGSAIQIYRALGFRDIPQYCANPVPGALFLELVL